MKTHRLLLCALLAWPTQTVVGAEFVARVMTVHEGDRVTIHYQGRNEMLTLRAVDCPDLKQPYGKQAKHAAAAYLANREVVLRELKKDQQGRVTADILLKDGRNIAHELVKEGLAWVRPGEVLDPILKDLEELARASKIGLWSEPDPIPPWKWKHTKPAHHN
jgi:endonuclease YncB( thermonuclease family)